MLNERDHKFYMASKSMGCQVIFFIPHFKGSQGRIHNCIKQKGGGQCIKTSVSVEAGLPRALSLISNCSNVCQKFAIGSPTICYRVASGVRKINDYQFFFTTLSTNYRLFDTLSTNFIEFSIFRIFGPDICRSGT